MDTLAPRDEKDLADVVLAAVANQSPVDVVGGGSRSGYGRPTHATRRLSMSGLEGVILYEPSELVLTARAGTPLKTVADLIDQHGQELAFEPIDHGPLYGHTPDGGTIGGLIAVNASGPRRIKAGAARDHLLGFRAVSGRGEVFQSGGRVMKNVTGYDMSKLMTGAFGTLGVLSEVTVKVLPKAETQRTLVINGLDDATAIAVMAFSSGLPQDISGLGHVPAATVSTAEGPFSTAARAESAAVTALRVEGPEASVRQRIDDVGDALSARFGDAGCSAGAYDTLDAGESQTLWRAFRDATGLAGPGDQIWRISTAPTNGAKLVSALRSGGVVITRYVYDWAGGLIWLAVDASHDAYAGTIREVVDHSGGHATLVRASDDVRAAVPVFHPQPAALAGLTERVKRGFDPHLILNRGRMRDDF